MTDHKRDDGGNGMNVDAPHPWTLHDPCETGAPARITDDNDADVTLQRAWREVQILRTGQHDLRAGLRELWFRAEGWTQPTVRQQIADLLGEDQETIIAEYNAARGWNDDA